MIAFNKPIEFKNISESISDTWIYEIIDGIPYYRKGYHKFLNDRTNDEPIGCNSYQWKIIEFLLSVLFTIPSRSKYSIATNEPGLHIDAKNNLSGDILVFDKESVKGLSDKYIAVPPILHIEVDISVEIDNQLDIEYIENKTNKLLTFGVKKICWVFTKSYKILVIEKQSEWHWHSFNESIHLLEDTAVCLGDFLRSEGVEI